MTKTTFAAIKEAIGNKGFLVGVVGVILIIFLSSTESMIGAFRSEELLANGFHDTMIAAALTSDGMTLALPILAALPFTASFVDDMKSGFVKEYLPRTDVKSYLVGKCTACALSGGLVLMLGVFGAYVLATLVFSPMEAALPADAEAPAYFAELMANAWLLFCSGAFWAMVGLAFATMTGSKYMAYASPFVLYYVLIILYERYFDTLYVLYPKEWINPSDKWMWGNTGVALLLLELIIIVSLGFYAAAKRRLSQI